MRYFFLVLALWLCQPPNVEPLPNTFFERIASFVNRRNSTWRASRRMNLGSFFEPLWAYAGSIIIDPYRQYLPRRRYINRANVDIPDEFDARLQWDYCPTLREVSEQGSCASCWAMAPAEVMADRICIHSEGETIVRISSGNLLSCCRRCGNGCRGGYPSAAWRHWRKHGVVTGGGYHSTDGCQKYPVAPCDRTGSFWIDCPQGGPTPSCKRVCDDDAEVDNYKEELHFGETIYQISRNEEEIQLEIMNHGPVQAALRLYEDFLTYESGVYQHIEGNMLNYHAVRILGWGEENGVPYWLCANIWSEQWGENGFFKILRGYNHAEIESHINAGVPRLHNFRYKRKRSVNETVPGV